MDAPFSLPADYTPPTLEQRCDAAEAIMLKAIEAPSPDQQELMTVRFVEAIEELARAFAPEHFKDTDTTTGKD